MEPRISIITLGVSDIGRATRFYRDGLGFPVHEAGGESITFFALHDLLLALYPRDALATDIGEPHRPGAPPPAWHGFTIAHNVATRAEVDTVLSEAQTAGARLVKPAAETFWGGYSGYFADLDGFLWEVATGSGLPTEPDSPWTRRSTSAGTACRPPTGE